MWVVGALAVIEQRITDLEVPERAPSSTLLGGPGLNQ